MALERILQFLGSSGMNCRMVVHAGSKHGRAATIICSFGALSPDESRQLSTQWFDLSLHFARLSCRNRAGRKHLRRSSEFATERPQLLLDALVEHPTILEHLPRLWDRQHE